MKCLWQLNYLVLVFVGVIGCRLFLCTYMFVLFSLDLAEFASDSPAEWGFVLSQYAIFLSVVLLSWVFIWNGVKEAGLDQVALKMLGLDKYFDKESSASIRSSTRKGGVQQTVAATPGKAVRTSSPALDKPDPDRQL